MQEKKSHAIKVVNIPKGKAICKIDNKPVFLIVVVWSLTIFIFFTIGNKIVALPPFFYAMILTTKEKKMVFAGYNSFFVIYDFDDKNKCYIIYLSEVKKWCYVNKLFSPYVVILLNDGEKITLNNSGSEIVNYFRKVMRNKEVEKKK